MTSPNLSELNSLYGLYRGASRGGVSGGLQAGASAAKLGSQTGLMSGTPGAALGDISGIYSGLKAGGPAGYAQAGVNAVQLGSNVGAFSPQVGQYAGLAAIPLSIWNEAKTWESGKTGQDALGGASSGAAIGTAIMPGIGTAIGAVGGAIVGGLSSLFGPGAKDPENANFENYTQAYNKAPPQQKQQVAAMVSNPYVALAGYFDLRSGQLKGQNPIYQKYGRKGEQKFTNDLIAKVQQGKQAGIKDPTQMWNKVVQPWINSMGTWQDSNKAAMTALMQNMTGQVMAGTYQKNFKAIGGDTPFAQQQQAQPGSLRALPGALRGNFSLHQPMRM